MGGAPQARTADVESLLNLATEITDIEVNVTKVNEMETGLPQPKRLPRMQRELRLHMAKLQSLRALLRERDETIRATLEAIMARGGASE
jgi:hypothetical protein